MNFFRTTDTTDTTIWKPGLSTKLQPTSMIVPCGEIFFCLVLSKRNVVQLKRRVIFTTRSACLGHIQTSVLQIEVFETEAGIYTITTP